MDRSTSVSDTLAYLRANTSVLPISPSTLRAISDNRDFHILPNFDPLEVLRPPNSPLLSLTGLWQEEDSFSAAVGLRKERDLLQLAADSLLLLVVIPTSMRIAVSHVTHLLSPPLSSPYSLWSVTVAWSCPSGGGIDGGFRRLWLPL